MTGEIVRTIPCCASAASFVACDFVSFALVATTPSVVLPPRLILTRALPNRFGGIDRILRVRRFACTCNDFAGFRIDHIPKSVSHDKSGNQNVRSSRTVKDPTPPFMLRMPRSLPTVLRYPRPHSFRHGVGSRGLRRRFPHFPGRPHIGSSNTEIEQNSGRHDRHSGATECRNRSPFDSK